MERIGVFGDRQFSLVGQLVYEPGGPAQTSARNAALRGVGIRVYEGVDARNEHGQFLCVEDSQTGEESWYRIRGARLEPVSLQGLEHLPGDPR
jgi:hypothetical protein